MAIRVQRYLCQYSTSLPVEYMQHVLRVGPTLVDSHINIST